MYHSHLILACLSQLKFSMYVDVVTSNVRLFMIEAKRLEYYLTIRG